ncbi:glycosyltransferase family 2 protein [Dyadobacter sp. CY323]|uniref:glycosyltransferase n=1 Tax=Dyadobacter sp. CY323 TaxID=2907302 RepID=UPI001F301EC7|nr:glycosyltransferase [Dyadobacter sp. CY323]MCE6989726.1 glycosyltransferase [Dyadobacter sp. CY323]
MASVKISVIIPTYRRPALLQKCLEAIVAQTYPTGLFEVIVVSDGPDAETQALMAQITKRDPAMHLTFQSAPERRGPAAVRNIGWRKSSGELVVFTDDDCIPSIHWLEEYWQAYKQAGRVDVAFTGKVEVPVPDRPTDYEKNVAHLATAEFITANCACTRLALELTGGFDEDFPTAWREDSDLHFKLLKKRVPIIHADRAVVCHPVRKAFWGVSISDQRKSMFNALLFKKHPGFYRQKIHAAPVWSYYVIILSSIVALIAWIAGADSVFAAAGIVWLASIAWFIARRLRGTNESLSHRLEMVITSLLIPYLSVYWTLRGAWRYKVLFL